jgi:hypothetical protein
MPIERTRKRDIFKALSRHQPQMQSFAAPFACP